MFFFFSLDHYNYAHWLAVYLRDMKCLPSPLRDSFSMIWVVSKTCHRFSALPTDQVPEQEKAHVKAKGGWIGLTERSDTLLKWMTG